MQCFDKISILNSYLSKERLDNKKIGLVPTMGALHNGHLALIKKSIEENDLTVCTIFVNPIQFNDEKDFANYPKNLDEDLSKLENSGCDVAFIPLTNEIYLQKPKVKIRFENLDQIMEGKFRHNHFSGVALVITKLLNIIKPNRAYFGEKDLQQLKIVEQLVKDFGFDVEVRGVQTQREKSGLALSSRNQRLSKDGKKIASLINNTLIKAKKLIVDGQSLTKIKDRLVHELNEAKIKVEYFELVDLESFSSIDKKNKNKVALCFAGFVEGIRLIDNEIF